MFHFECGFKDNVISSRLLDSLGILCPSVSKLKLFLHKSISFDAKSKTVFLKLKSRLKLCATDILARFWARVVKILSLDTYVRLG